jgi:hypothetical protein
MRFALTPLNCIVLNGAFRPVTARSFVLTDIGEVVRR